MKKTELTKEQQKEFKWLMEADTEDEDVEIHESGFLIWKNGTWKNGAFEDGFWEKGYWANGTWKGGFMWNNLKQKHVKVKYNKYKHIFEELKWIKKN
jgi:hypothetical protein